MTESIRSGDLLGKGLDRIALAICILVSLAVMLPFGLASIGFSAILGVAGGLESPSAENMSRFTGAAVLLAPGATSVPGPGNTDLASASAVLAQARSWLGTRYVFGGCSPTGIDCSCFVQIIFRSVGVDLPRTSQRQYDATVGRGFGTASPEPGDLVLFFRTYFDPGQDWTHVGIVSRVDSNGTVWMIDAPGARATNDPPDAPFGRVREEPVAGSWLQHRPTYSQIPSR